MELVKKKIHMDRISSRAGTQMVLEEDVNISDNKPDASHLLNSKGEVIMEEIRAGENVVNLRGRLVVSILYLTDTEGMCASMEAVLPFEERVNMEGVSNGADQLQEDQRAGGCGLRTGIGGACGAGYGGGYLS